MKYFLILIIPLSIFLVCNEANSECCSWSDRKACASCPDGYSSGCVTKDDSCNCDCAKSESELANRLANRFDDSEIEYVIRNNYDRIVRDTKRYGYYDYGRGKISISLPTR